MKALPIQEFTEPFSSVPLNYSLSSCEFTKTHHVLWQNKYTVSLCNQQQILNGEAEMGLIPTKYIKRRGLYLSLLPKNTHVRLTDRGRSRCFMPNSVSDL